MVTMQRTKTNVRVNAATSAVSHVLVVIVCSVSTVDLDSSSREVAAWKPVQRVTLATPPPWSVSDVTPLVPSVGVVVTETVCSVGRASST